MIAQKGLENLTAAVSAAKNLDQLFQFQPHLMDELLALIEIHLCIIACEAVPCSADGKALLVQQAAYLPDDQHVLALIIAAVAAPLDGFELREFLLPVAQNVRLDAAQVADLADGEVALSRDRRQLAVIAWFQHTLRRGPLVSGRGGM